MTLPETTAFASSTNPAVRAMYRLGRSVLPLSWAGALLGTSSLVRLARLPAGSVPEGSATGNLATGSSVSGASATAFEALALAARRRLDPLPQALFQAADDFQKKWLDRVPRDLSASSWRHFSAHLTADAAASLAMMRLDAEGVAVRQEIFHKLEVYILVVRASAALGPMADTRQRFEAAADRALTLDPRHALWALEGLAHGHARAVLARDPNPVNLLVGVNLPERGQVMAHLGLGMALTEHVFGKVDPRDPEAVEVAVERFVALCRSNSVPEHQDAALESLGLVLRCFFPELVHPVDRALRGKRGSRESWGSHGDHPLDDYFWHGVGRAIYFLPLHLLPGHGTIEVALHRLEKEVASSLDPEMALRNGRCGVAYAATMVNLGQPMVLERFVRQFPEAMDSAFVEGMASAALLRYCTTPDDLELAAFLEYRPDARDGELAERWHRLVIEPIEDALVGGTQGAGAVIRNLAARQLAAVSPDSGFPDSVSPDSVSPDGASPGSGSLAADFPSSAAAPAAPRVDRGRSS